MIKGRIKCIVWQIILIYYYVTFTLIKCQQDKYVFSETNDCNDITTYIGDFLLSLYTYRV